MLQFFICLAMRAILGVSAIVLTFQHPMIGFCLGITMLPVGVWVSLWLSPKSAMLVPIAVPLVWFVGGGVQLLM